MHVVATAGHVDHGKSTLVRALTGQDPDRLAEERSRGLSIELGYCWTDLERSGEVAFVDVPGHERFIATTLAGLGPVPVALLVVAADDPWMPQAAEHLAALDALDVRHGVLVVTRSDLADPGPALARARSEVARTSFADVPAVVVSGATGAGLDELRSVLDTVLAARPDPDPSGPVRLWTDRRFHVRGAGTVVTGTLVSGRVGVGDVLACGDEQVRVRGVESLGRPHRQVVAPARVALDLGGGVPGAVARGRALLTPGAFVESDVVDVALTGPDDVPERPVLHCGSARVGVRARVLGDGVARVRLERALPLHVGDRGVLRDPGSRRLWGLRVLDPVPPELRRRGAAAQRALDLARADGSVVGELSRRRVVRRSLLRSIGVPDHPLPDGTVATGDWLVDPQEAGRLRSAIVRLVEQAEERGSGGVAPAVVARTLDLPDRVVEALVGPPLRTTDGRLGTGRRPDLDPASAQALASLAEALDGAPFAVPGRDRLTELGLDDGTVGRLHRGGHVVRLASGVVVLPEAVPEAVRRLSALEQPFTTSRAREALETSRRVALPLLAHLDAAGHTLRLPDDRRRVRRGSEQSA